MALRDWICNSGAVATAKAAIPAIPNIKKKRPVARIAKIAIAKESESESAENKNIFAKGFGCHCGSNLYRQIEDLVEFYSPDDKWEHHYRLDKVWQCKNCKSIYEIIGGTKGPVLIQ